MVFVFPGEVDRKEVLYESEDLYFKFASFGLNVSIANMENPLTFYLNKPKKDEQIFIMAHNISSEEYRRIHRLFVSNGYKKVISPEEHEKLHYYNTGIYSVFKNFVPVSHSVVLKTDDDLKYLQKLNYKYVLKGSVGRTGKGWQASPNYYDSTFSIAELRDIINLYKKTNGEVTNTYVVQEYLPLKTYQSTEEYVERNELRLWFIRGRLVFVTDRTKGNEKNKTEITRSYIKKLPKLNCDFYTVDVAEYVNYYGMSSFTVLGIDDGQSAHIPKSKELTVPSWIKSK